PPIHKPTFLDRKQYYSLPRTRSTTQHPRTCGPGPRQWPSTSSLVHPASCSTSARMGIAPKSRDSYIPFASATAVDVRHAASNATPERIAGYEALSIRGQSIGVRFSYLHGFSTGRVGEKMPNSPTGRAADKSELARTGAAERAHHLGWVAAREPLRFRHSWPPA